MYFIIINRLSYIQDFMAWGGDYFMKALPVWNRLTFGLGAQGLFIRSFGVTNSGALERFEMLTPCIGFCNSSQIECSNLHENRRRSSACIFLFFGFIRSKKNWRVGVWKLFKYKCNLLLFCRQHTLARVPTYSGLPVEFPGTVGFWKFVLGI